nr:non-structural protein [Barleria severe mosaic virus]
MNSSVAMGNLKLTNILSLHGTSSKPDSVIDYYFLSSCGIHEPKLEVVMYSDKITKSAFSYNKSAPTIQSEKAEIIQDNLKYSIFEGFEFNLDMGNHDASIYVRCDNINLTGVKVKPHFKLIDFPKFDKHPVQKNIYDLSKNYITQGEFYAPTNSVFDLLPTVNILPLTETGFKLTLNTSTFNGRCETLWPRSKFNTPTLNVSPVCEHRFVTQNNRRLSSATLKASENISDLDLKLNTVFFAKVNICYDFDLEFQIKIPATSSHTSFDRVFSFYKDKLGRVFKIYAQSTPSNEKGFTVFRVNFAGCVEALPTSPVTKLSNKFVEECKIEYGLSTRQVPVEPLYPLLVFNNIVETHSDRCEYFLRSIDSRMVVVFTINKPINLKEKVGPMGTYLVDDYGVAYVLSSNLQDSLPKSDSALKYVYESLPREWKVDYSRGHIYYGVNVYYLRSAGAEDMELLEITD